MRAVQGITLLAAISSLGACNGSGTTPPPATDTAAPIADPAPIDPAAPTGTTRPVPPLHVDGDQVLEQTTSAYSTIRVRQAGALRSLVFVSTTGRETHQTTINVERPELLHSPYAAAMFVSLIYAPKQDRVLIVGLGGGAMIQFLRHHLPDTSIDAVELDPAVVDVADRWFGVRSGPRTRIVSASGQAFLAEARERWDAIYLDTFLDPANDDTDGAGVPLELQAVAFLRLVDARLHDHGVAIFNLHHKSRYADHVAAIREVFPHVRVLKVNSSNNRIVVASRLPHGDDAELRARAEALDGSRDWGFSFAALLDNLMD